MGRMFVVVSLACLGMLVSSAAGQVSCNQGGFGLAIPQFGGYSPGAGIIVGQYSGGGIGFTQNGAGLAIPAFGNYNPTAGIMMTGRLPVGNFNYGPGFNSGNRGGSYGGGNYGGNSGWNGPNQWQGGLPGANVAANPTDEADRAAAVKDAREAQNTRAIDALTRKAEAAEAAGRGGVAAMYYRMAMKRATGDRKADLEQRLSKVNTQSAPAR